MEKWKKSLVIITRIFLKEILIAGRKHRLEQENHLAQIITNMTNFTDAVYQFNIVRDKEMPKLHKLYGVIRVGLHIRNEILEQQVNDIARGYGATMKFAEWQVTSRGVFLIDSLPTYQAIQTYIFK